MAKYEHLKISANSARPNPLAPQEEKDTDEYGLKMAKLIEYEWFYIKSGGANNAYGDQRLKFDRLRKYARGEHSTDLHKKLITDGTDGESYTNYDWRPIQILPKFIKLVVNQMLERLYEIDAQAVDGISQGLRDKYKDILEKAMVSKKMLTDAKNLLGVDLMPKGADIPESSEELDLHMKLGYKPSIEIAIEEALKYTLELNEYDETQKTLLKDLTEIGVCALHHSTDPTKGIVVEACDPADMVWAYPTKSNFSNVYYYGRVKRMTVNELQRIAGRRFTEDEILNFRNVSNDWQGYNRISNEFWYRGEDLASWMVDVLFFTYKTTKTNKFKKKYRSDGSFKVTKRESTFMKPDSVKQKEDAQGYKDFDVLEEVMETWYEGAMVLGSDAIFNYGECKNMVRPKGFINNRVSSNYIMYAPELYQGRIQSLVSRVINDVDQLQQLKIKIQQFIAKAKPNGVYIDIDGLDEVDLGDGNTLSPLELIRFYDDTGNLIGTSRMADGSIQNGRAIQELNNGQIAGLEQLMGAYNFSFNLLRDAIGIGAGADATLPHPKTSVGAIEQNQINSNVATRYILESQLKMTQYLCNGLSLRIKDIFKFSNLKNAYINSIGKINVDVLESIKSLHLHDFGITIKLKPDGQERAMLEQNIQAEIASGGLSTTDGIDIRKIGNLAMANEMIKIRKAKHVKQQHERELEKIKTQSQSNSEAAQAASQVKQAEISLANEGKKEVETLKGDNNIRTINRELEAKKELMALEYFYQTGIKIEEAKVLKDRETYKEDRKDDRQAESATQQSQIKAESKKEKPNALAFKSAHSSITGELGLDDFRA
jgi:hypothetical protein